MEDYLRSNDLVSTKFGPLVDAFGAAGGDAAALRQIIEVDPAYLQVAFDTGRDVLVLRRVPARRTPDSRTTRCLRSASGSPRALIVTGTALSTAVPDSGSTPVAGVRTLTFGPVVASSAQASDSAQPWGKAYDAGAYGLRDLPAQLPPIQSPNAGDDVVGVGGPTRAASSG